MAWVFGHHNAHLLLPSEEWKSFLVIHKANLTAKVARCRTAHAYECRKSSENRHGRHRDLGKKIQPHQKKGFDRFALTGWTVTRASKRAGLRIHIYNTWAGGPQKGHEMLCHLHTCLNDQIKIKKKKIEQSMQSLCGAERKEHRGNYQRWQDFSAPNRACPCWCKHWTTYVPLPTECKKKSVRKDNWN